MDVVCYCSKCHGITHKYSKVVINRHITWDISIRRTLSIKIPTYNNITHHFIFIANESILLTKKIKADGVFAYDEFYIKQGLTLAENLLKRRTS